MSHTGFVSTTRALWDSAATKIHGHVFAWTYVLFCFFPLLAVCLGVEPLSCIIAFTFLRNCWSVFHDAAHFTAHLQYLRALASPHPLMLVVVDSTGAVLICAKWHHTEISICVTLITKDVEHPFMCLLAICGYFWRNVYSDPLPIF